MKKGGRERIKVTASILGGLWKSMGNLMKSPCLAIVLKGHYLWSRVIGLCTFSYHLPSPRFPPDCVDVKA